ncbi:acyl-CoA thioesterase [Sphingomonas sp. Leaf339]|uniref:acyl-CoA thioesterase n=1 Tax=Sphingomonas sp. Leaf339 TaxID=1736343 RepID=UPI000A864421|nr:acyl-CoA thioesterase [Sphingomonas sp. Leaf339]
MTAGVQFRQDFVAAAADIDELGHVNNAVWVRWIQDMATAHWAAVAPAEHQAAYAWVVTRHEIDYRGNLTEGGRVTGETWVGEPKGARFDRHVRFVDDAGRVKVAAVTTWALIDRATGRLLRVRPEVAAPFLVRD